MLVPLSILVVAWDIPPWKWPLHSDLHGGALTTNKAIHGGCKTPQRRILGFMSQQLHILTYWWLRTASDHQRLLHWLRHYIEVLGALPKQIHMYVPHWTNSSGESMRLLRATGIDVRSISKDERRHVIELYNAELRAYPEGSWYMAPDADEFYHFPCSDSGSPMASLVTRGFDTFCGFMEDMASLSGRLDPIDEARAPSSQAPPLIAPSSHAPFSCAASL
jgi:hypothetical protein